MIFNNILPQAKFKIYWVGAARPSRLRISRSVPIEDLASLVFGKSIVYPKIDREPVFNCYHQQHRELNLIWLCQVLKAICEKFCPKYSPKIFSHTDKINAHKALKKFKPRWFFLHGGQRLDICILSVRKSSLTSRARKFYEQKINKVLYNYVRGKACHLKH
jgi:hypothetical protein